MSRRAPNGIDPHWVKAESLDEKSLVSRAGIAGTTRNIYNCEPLANDFLRLAVVIVLPDKIAVIIDFVYLVSM
jgi:hypothetical protein